MNLALDLTKELLKSDGTDWQNASGPEVHRAMRHAEAALLFMAQHMDRYLAEQSRYASARRKIELTEAI